jgi:cbb3-type cytochrome oxidase cytochrome c subunit
LFHFKWGSRPIFPDVAQKSIKQSKAIGKAYLINKNYQIYQSIVLAYDSLRSLDCSIISKE